MEVIDINAYPSMVAEHKEPFGKTTNQYQFVSTERLVQLFGDQGWYPVHAQESAARKFEGYQRHLLRFRQDGAPSLSQIGEAYGEIVLENSHDGSKAVVIDAGVFVKICGNGLVVAQGLTQSFRIKHIGFTEGRVIEAIASILAAMPRLSSMIRMYEKITLSDNERRVFVQSALYTRYDEQFLKRYHIEPDSLFASVRPAQAKPTLWNVFNVVQENMINGGIRFYRQDEDGEYDPSVYTSSRRLSSIQERTRVNKALWAIADHTAMLKVSN